MKNKAVITVLGVDKVGIVANVSNVLAETNVNIDDISQTILDDLFAMIMLVSFDEQDITIEELQEKFKVLGDKIGMGITIQHEDLFRFMHRI